jgi:hypothetical protein
MFGKTNPQSDSRTNNCIIHSYASLMDTKGGSRISSQGGHT